MKKNYFFIIVIAVIIVSALILKINQISNNNRQAETNYSQNPVNTTTEQNNNFLVNDIIEEDKLLGSDRDEHGCILSAGYSWCETKEKCLRVFEEDCPAKVQEENSVKAPVEVAVESPLPGDIVSSPLEVRGRALGNWFFEAILPLKLITEDGEIITDHFAQAESDWMSEDFVPFRGILEFSTTASSGYLVVNKNNPSGLKEYNSQISIPIKFNNE